MRRCGRGLAIGGCTSCSSAKGLAVNHKRVHRIYQAAGLQVRRRRRKRLTRAERVPLPTAESAARALVDGLHDRHAGRRSRISGR